MGDAKERIAVQLRQVDEDSGERRDRAESEQRRNNAKQQTPAYRKLVDPLGVTV